jgi:3-ketosteroid 9alpha-monooxygenase subunit A
MPRTCDTWPIPDGWFQVAYSDELQPGAVLPLEYFGRSLVLFRTQAGQANVLDAFCPHLGAHLAHGGTVRGECIRCPIHAWEFDGAGQCTSIPHAHRIAPSVKLRSWPVHEWAGLIMVWHHAQSAPPSWLLPDVPEYGNPEWTDYERRRWKVRTRNRELAESSVASAHYHFVRRTGDMPKSEGEVRDHIVRLFSDTAIDTTERALHGRVESMSFGFGATTLRFKGLLETLLITSVTPIDSDNADVRFSVCLKKLGGAEITKSVSAAFIGEVSGQLERDIPV